MFRFAVVLVLGLTIQVHAQNRDEGLRISRAEFERHVEALDLAPHQNQAAEAIYLAHANEFNDAMKMHKELNAWLWTNTSSHSWFGGESPQPFYDQVIRENRELDLRWQRGARELERQYFERLSRIAIGAEQTIASFERQHRRNRMLVGNLGLPTGASCDLVQLIADLEFQHDASPSIATILSEYEQSLDVLLRQFDEISITSQLQRDEAGSQLQLARQSQDAQAIERAADALANVVSGGIAIGFEIWQLQQHTADRLVTALQGQERVRFRDVVSEHVDAFAHQADPFAHEVEKPPIERLINSALRDRSITAETKLELEKFHSRYVVLREQTMPGLRLLFSRIIEPATRREGYRLGLLGDHQKSIHHWNAILEPWRAAHGEWIAECNSIRNEIEQLRREAEAAP